MTVGNTQGGVLLKHIPYLPSPAATSLEVGLGPESATSLEAESEVTVESGGGTGGGTGVIATECAKPHADNQDVEMLKQKVEVQQ